MQLDIATPTTLRPKIAVIPTILVNERATLQVRFAKPVVFSGVLFTGFAAMLLLNYPFARSTFFQKLLGIVLVSASWAAVAYAVRAFYRLFRHSLYVPGRSFILMRGTDAHIALFYRACMWLGILLLPSVILLSIYLRPAAIKIFQSLASALGMLVLGYYGRIAKSTHADIDHVAVYALRAAGLLKREKVYAAHQNFDPTVTNHKHEGQAIFGVLADGIVLLYADASGWHQARKQFSDLSELGIEYKRVEVLYLLRFVDGSKYAIKIDMAGLTTEVLTFTRQFLNALDDAIAGSDRNNAGPGRHRIVETQHTDASDASAPSSDVGRRLDLSSVFIKEASAAVPIPAGRVIELSC